MAGNRFSLRPANAERLVLTLILALAALLRLAALGRDGLWTDECYGALKSVLPFRQLLPELVSTHEAPLYQLTQMPFAAAAGPSEWGMRFPSALLGILTVAMLWALARKIISPRAGLIAAFLLAVSPLHVHYSREARNYALLTFAVLVALWAAVRLARRPTPGAGIMAGAALLAVLYTHDIGAAYAAGIMAAGVALSMRSTRKRAALAALAIAFTVMALGYLPRLSAALSRSTAMTHEYDWLRPSWQRELPWQIGRSLAAISHGSMPPIRNHVRAMYWTVWPALGLSALLVGLGFRRRRDWRLPDGSLALAFAFLLPLIGIFAYSLLVTPIYSVGRVDAAVLPFFIAPVAAGVASLPSRTAIIGALAAFAGLALLPLQLDIRLDTRSQERSIARHLAATLADGDALVLACSFRSSQEYYLRYWKPGVTIQSFPAIRELHPFWIDWDSVSEAALGREALEAATRARDAVMTRGGKRVWVMLEPDARNGALLPELARAMDPGPLIDLRYMGLKLASFQRSRSR